jgi:flagellar assembly factor FliW
MQIETTRFGTLDVPEEQIIQFPQGLFGLPQVRHYCVLTDERQGAFKWLQAVEDPAIALVIADPFVLFPDYEVQIPDGAAEALKAADSTDVTVFTTISVAAEQRRIFANLLGPIAINHLSRTGMQLIQDSNRYTTRHPVTPPTVAGEAA